MNWTTEYNRNHKINTLYPIDFKSNSNIYYFLLKWILVSLLIWNTLPAYTQHSVAYLRSPVSSKANKAHLEKVERGIPFELIRGMIVMHAEVNYEVGAFILDTGAPLVVLNDQPDQAQRLAASFKKEIRIGDTTIKTFKWAGLERKRLDALVLDISHLESAFDRPLKGMIGYNVFDRQELYFDYDQQLILPFPAKKNDLHKNAKPVYTIPFELYDHLPVITIQIGKRKLRMGLDTGACTNLIDQSMVERLSLDLMTSLPDEEVQGLDQSVNRVKAYQIDLIKVKDLQMKGLKFLSTDLPQLQSESGLALDGLLGYSFLSQMKFSINYPKGKIYVWE